LESVNSDAVDDCFDLLIQMTANIDYHQNMSRYTTRKVLNQ